jgi:hypothetical protein
MEEHAWNGESVALNQAGAGSIKEPFRFGEQKVPPSNPHSGAIGESIRYSNDIHTSNMSIDLSKESRLNNLGNRGYSETIVRINKEVIFPLQMDNRPRLDLICLLGSKSGT